jgi:hypothetical protein
MFYDDKFFEINRYNKYHSDHNRCNFVIKYSEYETKKNLAILGDIKKIPERNIKTADFIIQSKSIIFEVKSINTEFRKKLDIDNIELNIKNKNQFIEKMNLTINDICAKNVDQSKYFFCGVIYIDIVQHIFNNFLWDYNFIKSTNFAKSKLDGILFLFAQASGNIKNKKPIFFIKNKQLRENIDKDLSHIKIYYLNKSLI